MLIGQAAILHSHQHPIFSIRKLVEDDLKNLNDKRYHISINGEIRKFSPIQLVALFLMQVKKQAEVKIKGFVKEVAISVPLYFKNYQRIALVQAARLAHLSCHFIFNTTAIGITATLDNISSEEKNVIIIDFGAGKLDISSFSIEAGGIIMKANCSDATLGGQLLTDRLVTFCVAKFSSVHNSDISTSTSAIQRLKMACEAAKITLSQNSTAKIEVKELIENIDFSLEISRDEFIKLCEDLFAKIPAHLEQLISESKLIRDKFDDIILYGGSSRIPQVQSIISSFFGGKTLAISNFPQVTISLHYRKSKRLLL